MDGVRQRPWLPRHGWAGVLLLAVSWPLNWCLPGPRTAYLFFPLWLGYVLAMDALVYGRSGTSLWTRSRRGFTGLFLLSAPAWWLFELINQRTANWEYLGAGGFTSFEYYLLCTLSFSTVMPAVFETAELARTFRWVDSLRPGPRIPAKPAADTAWSLAGAAMLTLTLAWPKLFYSLVWISLFLILDPLNHRLGRPSLMQSLREGDWRPLAALAMGALICGFFWEMWNYWSWPQWIYHTPGVNFLHVFEMPLLGYGGYIPFALELFALKNFLWPRGPQLRIFKDNNRRSPSLTEPFDQARPRETEPPCPARRKDRIEMRR
jgi:hypothetical protein